MSGVRSSKKEAAAEIGGRVDRGRQSFAVSLTCAIPNDFAVELARRVGVERLKSLNRGRVFQQGQS